ncbi:hypothetical protein DSC45_06885 [Streptomyces sp. YIM 130001]|uniref:hypothetical protein n=1 Tax=Streptomyces sp. YIM 130001 TaxID=2259644 RepID=UPI000E648047|nr:hypothetical protein [Streptomyces sp. YIM 130001]RII19719.1 hypothetical protein DSC45_06885 [Streptomyces sp. YIM 130001]
MMLSFEPPPRAEEISRTVKKKLAEAKESGGTRETVTVDWNDRTLHVEVIDVPLTDLYYNPGTHRIRAQRSHDAGKDAALDEAPWSTDSQRYLEQLLMASPSNPAERDSRFDALKVSLSEFGQSDPGLVTHHGVLVNGNTRAAGLRDLGRTSMRVGVLPASFSWADINAVELSLQLRNDHRRDYSYINRLLAMEEQASVGRIPGDIARDFRIREATYHQERWILGVVRELIKRSSSRGGVAALRLVDFEDDQEKLKELHRRYEKLKSVDPDQAEALKEARLAAILLGFSKTDVRHIDETFLHSGYLDRNLPPNLTQAGTEPEPQPAETIAGLDMPVPETAAAVAAARSLTDRIVRAKAAARGGKPGLGDAEMSSAQEVVEEAKEAFDRAIDAAGRDARVRKRKQLAPARLADACVDIDQCVADFVQARASQSLDEEAFDEALLKLRSSISKLAQQAGRGASHPGDGLAWLLGAAKLELHR